MYTVPQHIDPNKIFLINRSQLEGRFDPFYMNPEKVSFFTKLKGSKIIVKLQDVILEGSYGILPPGDSYNSENPIKFIRATELKSDLNIDFENVYFVEEKYYGSRASLKKNDILLAVKGATIASNKCVALVRELNDRCIVNGSIFRFQVKENVNNEYIAYMLNSELLKKQMKFNLVANNAVDYLDKNLIYNLLIPLPSKNVQQQIVDIYNHAYQQKQAKEAQAKVLLASIDSYLLGELGITLPEKDNSLQARMFTTQFSEVAGGRLDAISTKSKDLELALFNGKYSTIKLTKLIKGIKTGTTPHNSLNPYGESGIPFLRNSNLQNGELNLNDVKYVKAELSNHLTYSYYGELIVCIAGTVGETAINNSEEPIAINQNVTALSINENLINLKYLNYFFNTRINLELIKRLSSIATILYLNNSNLLSLNTPLPPIEKQNEIANHIQGIRNQAKVLQQEAEAILNDAKAKVEQMILG